MICSARHRNERETAAVMTTDTATAMLRGALVPTLVVGTAAVVASALMAGAAGAWGALAGAVLVIGVFWVGLVVLRAASALDPVVTLLVALALYVGKVVVLGVTFFAVDVTGVLDDVVNRTTLALTVIVCTLAWTVGEIIGTTRAREPLYRLDKAGGR